GRAGRPREDCNGIISVELLGSSRRPRSRARVRARPAGWRSRPARGRRARPSRVGIDVLPDQNADLDVIPHADQPQVPGRVVDVERPGGGCRSPLASVAVTLMVCGPLAKPVVAQSILNTYPLMSVAAAFGTMTPLTLAPSGGSVKVTVCLMVTPAQFATVSLIDARPVALALSLTVTVAVRAPLSAAVVGHASEPGPLLV